MYSYEIMDKLVNDGLCYASMDINNSTVSLDIDTRKYYDDGTDFHFIEFSENVIQFPLGENLFNFLALSDETLHHLQGLAGQNSGNWNGLHEDDEERKYIASLECIYLYILYYSPCRQELSLPDRSSLINLKKEFEFALNFCCNSSFIPELSDLSALDRYYIYCELYNDNFYTNIKRFTRSGFIFLESNTPAEKLNSIDRMDCSNEKYRDYQGQYPITDKLTFSKEIVAQLKKIKVSATTRYQYGNLYGYLIEELYNLIQLNTHIKKCKFCNKYFIPKGNYASEYCDRIMPGERFSCKKLAAMQTRKEKVKSNPILQEYERAYKRMYARVTARKLSQKDFKEWTDSASLERDRVISAYEASPTPELINSFKNYLGNR
ncbi:hypothetical protein DXC27_09615 [Ruminococcus sp. OM08-7]|nr:hypothetical protein DXC27_09615 [Ruminococcus sp. OM08-7]